MLTSKALKLSVSFVDRTQPHCAALTPNDAPICLKPHHGITRYHSDPGEEAARRYIAERDAKRALIVDIPRHALRTPGEGGSGRFAGWRQIDEQPLVLLKNRNSEIIVMPVDMGTLARVKRLEWVKKCSLTRMA